MSTTIAAAATSVGKVREHNEDSHLVDVEAQLFVVADGMGGHAAGEVASATAIRVARASWTGPAVRRAIDDFAEHGDAGARRALVHAVRQGAIDAHLEILRQAGEDEDRSGMGTTFTGLVVAGGTAVFAHVGDSRAYLVRDAIAMQLSEDHTLLSRMQAAGVEPGEGEEGSAARWKGVLTNALGIGGDPRVAVFLVPLYSGDRLVLCSDGVHEYLTEGELGEAVVEAPSPARAAQRLVDLALERGGGDNATAVVVKVLEADETRLPKEQQARDERAIARCPLFEYLTERERLRALRITTPRELKEGRQLAPVALGERVAYIVLEGLVRQGGRQVEAGGLIYPEALVAGTQTPDRERRAVAEAPVRLLTIRRDDFFELTEEESELGVKMYAVLAKLMAR
jgi:serine/threonine protein phosphatase PrpC